jgi:pyridoxal phosphate enzyme (YggS family)
VICLIDFQTKIKYITRLEMANVADNVKSIRHKIALACERAGRSADEVTLVAVSKTFDSNSIHQAVEAGVVDIGENFVQELARKRDALQDERIRWHFIGHLQTNKVKYIAGWIHLVHAVDSLHLAKELDRHAGRTGRRVDVLIEVNTSGEATKFGVQPEQALPLIHGLSPLQHLRVLGLMTMGPFVGDAEVSRPAFRILKEIGDRVQQDGFHLPHLSMGMTGDFETAIEEGATIVRIGTAIFGPRATKA